MLQENLLSPPSTYNWTQKALNFFSIYTFSAPQLIVAITQNDLQNVEQITKKYFHPSYASLVSADKQNIIILAGTASKEMLIKIMNSYHLDIDSITKEEACQFFIKNKQFEHFVITQSHHQDVISDNIIKIMAYLYQAQVEYPIYQLFYDTMIQHPNHIHSLEKCFSNLIKANLKKSIYPKYFKYLIQNIDKTKQLEKCLSLLAESGLIEKENQDFYDQLIKMTSHTKSLIKYFSLLKRNNLTGQSHKGFFEFPIRHCYHTKSFCNILNESKIENSIHSTQLSQCLSLLSKINFPINYHQEIFRQLIKHKSHAIFIEKYFSLLYKNNLTQEKHHQFYYDILENPYKAQILFDCLSLLSQANFTTQKHQELCIYLVSNADISTSVIQGFLLLLQENLKGDTFWELYQFLILIKNRAVCVAKGFVLLSQANLSVNTHPNFYKIIPKHATYAESLAKCLILMKKAGFTETENSEIYNSLFKKSNSSSYIEKGFEILTKNNITEKHHTELYLSLISKAYNAESLAKCFTVLVKGHLTLQSSPDIFAAVIKKSHQSVSLAKCFELLYQANLTSASHKNLYQALINKSYGSEDLAKSFVLLADANLTLYDHPELYNTLIKITHGTETLAKNFVSLAKANLNYHSNPEIYYIVSENPQINWDELLSLLVSMGITYSNKNKDYFSKNFLSLNAPLSQHVLQLIKYNGFTLQHHEKIIRKMMAPMILENPNIGILLNNLSHLVEYARANTLLSINDEGYSEQIKILEEIIDQEINLTEGPLNKSEATFEIERILKLMAVSDISKIQIHYDALGYYILHIPNEPEINLSLLLRNANLTHLLLTKPILDENSNSQNPNEWIDSLGDALSKLIVDWDTFSSKNAVLKLLPVTQQKAIKIYTYYKNKKSYYININRLFRGEVLDTTINTLFITNKIEENNIICFLLGCLVSDAINKLPCLISTVLNDVHYQGQLSNYLAPQNALLDRGENLEKDPIEKQRRLANPWSFPALTSFSSDEKRNINFHKEGETTRTKIKNTPSIMPFIHTKEAEILIVPGTQVISYLWSERFLVNELVNSPLLDKPNHYWSDTALVYALKMHLSKEYKDEISEITIDGLKIVRCNHNAPHVFRGMNAIDLVLDYFTKHAKEPDFKDFCQTISHKNIEWLKVAAAFRVTGRESEISVNDNPERYNQYRLASANHFKIFVNKTKNLNDPDVKLMALRMYDILIYMGNRLYERGTKDKSAINNISNETEKQIRNFYHRILTIAHILDLARCYHAKQYLQSMQYCLDLSDINESQTKDFYMMIRYNIELIKAHGSCLSSDIKLDNTLFDVHHNYQTIFAKSSTSLTQLYKLTESVTHPKSMQILSKRM